LDELLTPREREVLSLIVVGQSNSAIAARLVISEGTVKSHVKQILRKIGAVNRSEAIARYLGIIGSN
jgi:DNA-binding NarL/FixJ family response regulator